MQLSKTQRRNLELYATYHSEPPTFGKLFRLNLGRYLVITVLLILLLILTNNTAMQSLSLIAIGIFIGVLIRDITRFLYFIRVWPATSAVIDWKQLDALLRKNDMDENKNRDE